MKTKNLSDEELLSYFEEHVRYEVQMLFNAAWAISQKLRITEGLQYMVVEAYALHLRNLIDFFYPSSIRDDDVCAKNFFLMLETWEEVRPPLGDLLDKARKRVHKEVSHLTTARLAGIPKEKEWNIAGYTRAVVSVIEQFVDTADRIDMKECCEHLLTMYYKIEPHLV